MSKRFHAVVWIDHREARVVHYNDTEESECVVQSHNSVQRLHQHSPRHATETAGADQEFFKRIVATLHQTGGTLITGPCESKHDLKRYIDRHRPDLDALISADATAIHPGEAALLVAAREFFATTAPAPE